MQRTTLDGSVEYIPAESVEVLLIAYLAHHPSGLIFNRDMMEEVIDFAIYEDEGKGDRINGSK